MSRCVVAMPENILSCDMDNGEREVREQSNHARSELPWLQLNRDCRQCENGDDHPREQADNEGAPPGIDELSNSHGGAESEQRHCKQSRLQHIGGFEDAGGNFYEGAHQRHRDEPRDEEGQYGRSMGFAEAASRVSC